jgi:phosphatidylinositol alpha-1,6-mannosyltransferase
VKVLVLSSEFPPGPGGIGTHAHQVSRHLSRLGWEVTVVAPQDLVDPAEARAFNAEQPFRVRSVPVRGGHLIRSMRRAATTVSSFRETAPDVVLATGFASVRVAGRFPHRCPAVGVAHGTETSPTSAVARRRARVAFGRMDAVVCVSEFTRSLVRALGISREDCVIPNGADDETFLPASTDRVRSFRARIGVGDAPLLLTVGTVKQRKGQDTVVRSLPRLVERWGVHYAVIGPELVPGRLAALAQELDLADHVHVLGPFSSRDLVDAYSACDVFVLASRRMPSGDCESFGIVAVEAALCARPAVVTDGSGLVEAVRPGATALVVPEDDPDAVADSVDALLAAPARRREMGEAARRHALDGLTWREVATRYDALLRRIVAREEQCAS